MKLETIKKSADFQKISNKKASTSTFMLLATPSNLPQSRVGFTVSKRVSKLAVERNRIKRRLRAIVREVLEKQAEAGTDYIIIGKKTVLARDYKDLIKDMEYALNKIHSSKTN